MGAQLSAGGHYVVVTSPTVRQGDCQSLKGGREGALVNDWPGRVTGLPLRLITGLTNGKLASEPLDYPRPFSSVRLHPSRLENRCILSANRCVGAQCGSAFACLGLTRLVAPFHLPSTDCLCLFASSLTRQLHTLQLRDALKTCSSTGLINTARPALAHCPFSGAIVFDIYRALDTSLSASQPKHKCASKRPGVPPHLPQASLSQCHLANSPVTTVRDHVKPSSPVNPLFASNSTTRCHSHPPNVRQK